MAIPWEKMDTMATEEGVLELRRRGERDFLITVGGRVLMNSSSHRSEDALGRLACEPIADRPAARVLVGGLGMGFTLRAVLDSLPDSAAVVVAELNPVVVDWCLGPLSGLTEGAAADPRVRIELGDVTGLVASSARRRGRKRFDAVVYDLYTGPYTRTHRKGDSVYGNRALATVRAALCPGGVFAVWGEDYEAGFAKRLEAAGFDTTVKRPGRGGPRHVIYLGIRPAR